MMQKELATTNGASSVPTLYASTGPMVDPSDILIPRLLLMQGLSEFVAKGEAKMGDIVKSTTGQVLAKPVAMIPLSYDKTWILTEKVNGQHEFRRVEPFTFENAHLPWEYHDNGQEWKRTMSLNFYVLLPDDIKRDVEAREAYKKTGQFPDASASLLPVSISFRSTSYAAGKVLTTHFAMAKSFPMPPYASTFKLSSETQTKNKKTFANYKVENAGPTPEAYLDACKAWHATVERASLKTDDEVETLSKKAEEAPLDAF
jgi:hypothetical protein